MFNINDVVYHKKNGICNIAGMTIINDRNYYILEADEDTSKIMIPIDNSNNLIRKVLSKEEIDKLVNKVKDNEIPVITEFKTRIRTYDEYLKIGDTEHLILIYKMIKKQKKEKMNLTTADKEILKKIEKLLFSEFSYVLKLERKELEKYILNV